MRFLIFFVTFRMQSDASENVGGQITCNRHFSVVQDACFLKIKKICV